MSAKKLGANDKNVATIDTSDAESSRGALKRIGGSKSDHWNVILLNQAAQALCAEGALAGV